MLLGMALFGVCTLAKDAIVDHLLVLNFLAYMPAGPYWDGDNISSFRCHLSLAGVTSVSRIMVMRSQGLVLDC